MALSVEVIVSCDNGPCAETAMISVPLTLFVLIQAPPTLPPLWEINKQLPEGWKFGQIPPRHFCPNCDPDPDVVPKEDRICVVTKEGILPWVP